MKWEGSPPLPAFRLSPGTGARWLGLFLTRTAERLRSGASGEALLIESWWDGHQGEVQFLSFSADLLLAVETLQEGIPLRWSPLPADRACEPPAGLLEEWFCLTDVPRPIPPDVRPIECPPTRVPRDPSRGPLELAAPTESIPLSWKLLPDSQPYWVGLQTHWTVGSGGQVWTACRGRLAASSPWALLTLGSALELHLRHLSMSDSGPELKVHRVRSSRRRRKEWASGARRWWGSAVARPLTRELVAVAAPFPVSPDPDDDPRLRQAVVLGASGSGKTAALAHLARQALAEGRSVVLFDVHGDLAPRVVAGLPPPISGRLMGIDVAGAPSMLPGLSVFGPVPPGDREALVAHLVAALKRLSTENGETFWGFRLERLFETFLRVVQEQGGDLVDLWNLLTDGRRRDAARLTTDRPEIAQFLEELDGIVRRQPDFLWPAASRVAKVVGSPLLTALLAPRERELEVGARLLDGESVLWRLPIGELGPEGVTFAVTLLLTRVYLEQVRRAAMAGPEHDLRVLFVLDEAHLFPARLLSEIVSEGRKFGLGLILATQYPARLAPELQEALTGAAGTVYLFRVPWASAVATGAWAGLDPASAEKVLPSLPPGWAVVGATGPDADRRLVAMPSGPPADVLAWKGIVERTAVQYGSPVPRADTLAIRIQDHGEEELLLGLVALEAEGTIATRVRLLRWLDVDGSFDPVAGLGTIEALQHRGWIRADGDTLHLAPAGGDRIGLTARTGARVESAEHRALLVAALRIFARHHERLEILRQGRFDTRLPDGLVTVLPREHRRWSPTELQIFLDHRRGGWMWRAFGGRDVYVEAEVSGATRRERIERDWTKARDAGAFLLCLVSDDARARSVRRFLARADAKQNRAMVWTLRSVQAVARDPGAT
ncbi:MAG: DUF853 family protein [Thermoplasmata archaeon]|nr:DUF853 family protein [Thermoplasmata archaeon]